MILTMYRLRASVDIIFRGVTISHVTLSCSQYLYKYQLQLHVPGTTKLYKEGIWRQSTSLERSRVRTKANIHIRQICHSNCMGPRTLVIN